MANEAITAKVKGSYDPKVELSDGREVMLSDLMIELYNQQGDIAGVKENIVEAFTRTLTNATASYKYSVGSEPESYLQIPTLAELGFSGDGFSLKVQAVAYLRADAQPKDISVKLVDDAAADIAGTETTATISSTTKDSIVKLPLVTVTGGAKLAVDFKQDTGTDTITLYHTQVLIQVVKS